MGSHSSTFLVLGLKWLPAGRIKPTGGPEPAAPAWKCRVTPAHRPHPQDAPLPGAHRERLPAQGRRDAAQAREQGQPVGPEQQRPHRVDQRRPSRSASSSTPSRTKSSTCSGSAAPAASRTARRTAGSPVHAYARASLGARQRSACPLGMTHRNLGATSPSRRLRVLCTSHRVSDDGALAGILRAQGERVCRLGGRSLGSDRGPT